MKITVTQTGHITITVADSITSITQTLDPSEARRIARILEASASEADIEADERAREDTMVDEYELAHDYEAALYFYEGEGY